MSSQLGKLMVDMLVESEQWIQDIMAFFSIFIKLKDTTTSKAFKVERGEEGGKEIGGKRRGGGEGGREGGRWRVRGMKGGREERRES